MNTYALVQGAKMERYHHRADNYRKGRRIRRFRRALFTVLALVVLGITAAAVFIFQQVRTEKPVVQKSARQNLGYYSGTPRKVFANDMLSFESSKDWQLSRGDSNIPSKYVFFSIKNNIVQYELTIYTNKTPPASSVNYILPVTVSGNKIVPQKISPKCTFPLNVKGDYAPQKYQEVSYLCSNSPSRETVAIGVVGDSYDVPLYTPKGAVKNIGMQFVDHTANPYEQVFTDIISSLKLN